MNMHEDILCYSVHKVWGGKKKTKTENIHNSYGKTTGVQMDREKAPLVQTPVNIAWIGFY